MASEDVPKHPQQERPAEKSPSDRTPLEGPFAHARLAVDALLAMLFGTQQPSPHTDTKPPETTQKNPPPSQSSTNK